MADRIEHPDEERTIEVLRRAADDRENSVAVFRSDAVTRLAKSDADLLRAVAAELPALRQQLTDATLTARYNADVASQAIARAEMAEAQLTEAQADRERLDWLASEAEKCEVVEIFDNVAGREGFSIFGMGAPDEASTGATFRDAIDDGIAATNAGLTLYEKMCTARAARASSSESGT